MKKSLIAAAATVFAAGTLVASIASAQTSPPPGAEAVFQPVNPGQNSSRFRSRAAR